MHSHDNRTERTLYERTESRNCARSKDRKPLEELRKQLTFSFKSLNPENQEEMNAVMAFCEDYKVALNKGKTGVNLLMFAVDLLEEQFSRVQSDEQLAAGDRVYDSVQGKGLIAAVIGSDSPDKGFNMIGSHVDSPRLDLNRILFMKQMI